MALRQNASFSSLRSVAKLRDPDEYLTPDEEETAPVEAQPGNGEKTTINLLLLGETGSGKSTWINGFANFVSFENLHDAREAGGQFPIKTKFMVTDPETYEEYAIWSHPEAAEEGGGTAAGHSVTQRPQNYPFSLENMTINVIDTPGLSCSADAHTDAHDTDKQHVENILQFIGRYDKLNAICILLKPNESRITSGYAYCITEILRNLHESACNNVIFILTNTKGTNYLPGNTLGTLKTFLKEKNLERIKISRDTIYCIENDIVQHIAMHKNGYTQSAESQQDAEKSWNKSSKTTLRMISYIGNLEPHLVVGTKCIFDARRLIGVISKLLLEVIKCSMANAETLEKHQLEIKKKTEEIQKAPEDYITKDLQNILYIKVQKVEVKKLAFSNTVCVSTKCATVVGAERHFPQVCCKNCKGFWGLWTCRAFQGITGEKCKHCKCNRTDHEWRATETVLVAKDLFDSSKEGISKVLNQDDALKTLNDKCVKIQEYLSQNEEERVDMLQKSAALSVFLRKCVLLGANIATCADDLKCCLEKELAAFQFAASAAVAKAADRVTGSSVDDERELIDKMNKHIQATLRWIKKLQGTIQEYNKYFSQAATKDYTTYEAYQLIDELYKLKQNGKMLKDAVTKVEQCNKAAMMGDEDSISFLVQKINSA